MTPDQLVKKWRVVLDAAEHVFTWTEQASLAYCAEVASRSEYGIECGSYMGASALVMLLANPKLHLWCVDLFMVAGTRKCCEVFLAEHIKRGACELITGDSATAAPMLQHMKGKLDFVWVDDGHATEDVKRDIRCFLPLLRPGGEMFGHDFDIPHNDVALGVIQSGISYDIVVPRVWRHVK